MTLEYRVMNEVEVLVLVNSLTIVFVVNAVIVLVEVLVTVGRTMAVVIRE